MLVDDAVKSLSEKYQHEPWFIAAGSGTVAGKDVLFVYVRKTPRQLPEGWQGYTVVPRRSGAPRAANVV